MAMNDVNDFIQEKECIYEEEKYSVRDNGAVFRHPRLGKRLRPNDNKWTFGITNLSNPYLHLSDVRVHRIVATAFHGEPPDSNYVVDHIDTNCRNNRPENLRWVTRLENALMNPVTRKKIEYLCGSVDAFLKNPSMLNKNDLDRNTEWMRTVTLEEAKNCMENISIWAERNKRSKGGSLGEWIYKRTKYNRKSNSSMSEYSNTIDFKIGQIVTHKHFGDGVILHMDIRNNIPVLQIKFYNTDIKWIVAHLDFVMPIVNKVKTKADRMDMKLVNGSSTNEIIRNTLDGSIDELFKKDQTFDIKSELVMSITADCAQKNWKIPSNFPCCPTKIGANPIDAYFQNLKYGAVFAYNDSYPKSIIIECEKINNNSSILVMCEREGIKPFSIAEITFTNALFIHSNLGSFYDRDGAAKQFFIKQGLEWIGNDTFDDFC